MNIWKKFKRFLRLERADRQTEAVTEYRVPRQPIIKPRVKRQPASQTYTAKKIRGLPPKSARSKRMWRVQVSKEELEEGED